MSRALVARGAEDRALAEFLERVAAGPSGLAVEGEPGIGKSTLLWDAADRATAMGYRVLSARGAPSEVTYAYAAAADLLRVLDDELPSGMPAVQRAALDKVLQGHGEGPATDERLVAAAFLSVLEALTAKSPVLVCIDDAQWLDKSSRAVLGFAARRLAGPVGMIATIRSGEHGVPDAQAWLTFAHPNALARITMRPLSLGAVHKLVMDRLNRTLPRPAITRIYETSAGNPFFAIELAHAIVDRPAGGAVDLPTGLAALVRDRIGHHDDDDVGAVLLAAGCAAAPTVELISQATGYSAIRVAELLEPIEGRGIVELDGNRVRFTHPLFATGVYTNASRARRRATHRTLAGIVDQPELKARHLALAATTGDPDTLSALDAAAEATFARGAPAVAAELVELAFSLGGDTPERRVRAAEFHFRAGSLAPARLHLETTLADLDSGILRCLALMMLGAVRGYDDDAEAAVDAMAEAVVEAGDNAVLRLQCLLRLVLAMVMTNRLGEAVEHAGIAVTEADRLGVPGLRSQALSISVASKFVHGFGADRDALQTAVELEDTHSGATTWFRACATEAMINAYSGDLDRARTQMREVRRRMHEGGTEVEMVWADVHVSAIDLWLGRYDDATEAACEAVQRAEQMGGRLLLITAWTVQAAAAAYAGRVAEARAVAATAVETAHAIGGSRLAIEPMTTLGFLDVSAGDYAAALTTLAPLIDGFDDHGLEIEGGAYVSDAVEAFIALGRLEDAEPLIAAMESAGRRHDRPWQLAVAARGRSQLSAARGNLAEAVESAELAMEHHQRLPMPFERARTQLLLGQLLRRQRRKHPATAALTETLRVFEELGSPLWADRVRAELARTNVSPTSGPKLTPSEQRVAELAAAGMTNRDIAKALFISPKTVEHNVARVYRKLGIHSRAELGQRMDRLGEVQDASPGPVH